MIEIIDTDEWLQIYKDGTYIGNISYMLDSEGWHYIDRLLALLKKLGHSIVYYGPYVHVQSDDPDDMLKEARSWMKERGK